MRGREVPDPGPGPDRTDPADHARATGAGHPDYVRNGTTTLFAALEVATGRVEQACLPRHRHQEFLRFLKQVAKAYPQVKLHLVVDNYATHRRGTFGSVRELIDAIGRFIHAWNERCEPFIWTKDADTIIANAHRKSTSGTRD